MTAKPREKEFVRIPDSSGNRYAKDHEEEGGGHVDELGDHEGVRIFSNFFLYVVEQASRSAFFLIESWT